MIYKDFLIEFSLEDKKSYFVDSYKLVRTAREWWEFVQDLRQFGDLAQLEKVCFGLMDARKADRIGGMNDLELAMRNRPTIIVSDSKKKLYCCDPS